MRAVTLLAYGADTEQTDADGRTPLVKAAMADSWLYVQALILNSKQLLTTDIQRWTALHYAAFHSNYRSLQTLVRGMKDFDLNTLTDYAGNTPFHIARRMGCKEVERILQKEDVLGTKVVYRLLNCLREKGKEEAFSLETFQRITASKLLAADWTDELDAAESYLDTNENGSPDAENDIVVKNPWKRAGENAEPVAVPKSSEKKGLLGKLTDRELRKKNRGGESKVERVKQLTKRSTRHLRHDTDLNLKRVHEAQTHEYSSGSEIDDDHPSPKSPTHRASS